MEASGGGTLVINAPVNNAGGTITTANSTEHGGDLLAATVAGGTLNNTAGGTFETVNSSELDGSTHGALTISVGSVVTATDNNTTYLVGTIKNAGTIALIRRQWAERIH